MSHLTINLGDLARTWPLRVRFVYNPSVMDYLVAGRGCGLAIFTTDSLRR